MIAPVTFSISFDVWCSTVNYHLAVCAARGLADLPIPDGTLRLWWSRGVRAQALAALLATVRVPARVTIQRCFGDDQRVRDLRVRTARRLAS